jgi:hypothetical protein
MALHNPATSSQADSGSATMWWCSSGVAEPGGARLALLLLLMMILVVSAPGVGVGVSGSSAKWYTPAATGGTDTLQQQQQWMDRSHAHQGGSCSLHLW